MWDVQPDRDGENEPFFRKAPGAVINGGRLQDLPLIGGGL